MSLSDTDKGLGILRKWRKFLINRPARKERTEKVNLCSIYKCMSCGV